MKILIGLAVALGCFIASVFIFGWVYGIAAELISETFLIYEDDTVFMNIMAALLFVFSVGISAIIFRLFLD